jgi:hypothetical protein
MRLKIDQFLKAFGLRQVSELQTPRLHALKKFDFPMETVYHFSDENTAVIGPSQTDPIIEKLKGKVFIEHITELTQLDGNPKRTSVLPVTLMNDFRKQHRFFKPLRRDDSVKLNPQNVALFNYNMLNPLYRYIASYKSTFMRWSNNTATEWDHIADAVKRYPTWNHFVELHVPTTMPTMAQFKQLENQQNQHLLEVFNTGNLLTLFDVFRFLGTDRKVSYMSKVPKEYFNQINFFVRVAGSFFVINLGKLDAWRDQTAEEIEADELAKAQVAIESHDYATLADLGFERYIDAMGLEAYFKPEVLQRRFISLMATLVEYANGNEALLVENDANVQANSVLQAAKAIVEPEETDVVVEPDEEDTELDADEARDVAKSTVTDDTVTDQDVTEAGEPLSKVYKSFDLDILTVTYVPPPEADLDTTTLQIENDEMSPAATKTLKVEERRPQQARGEEFTTGDELLDGVAKRSYALAKSGMISERTFEQSIDAAMSYETMPDPFGSGLTVKEAMQYSPEDFEVPVSQFPDKTTIMDKAMLKSVHKPMMRKYIKTLLPKDILNGIMFIQRQGVSVTDIKIRENEDVMNHTQTFTVTVKPVRGVASNLEFTIPVIDKDGRFLSNGVTYRQRIQRSDKFFTLISNL